MNYQQGNRWTADLSTDQATLDSGTPGGSGSGGTTTVVSGGGPNGEDVWEYTTLGASSQRYIQIDGFNDVIQSAIGLWVKLPSYPALKKVFIFLGQGGYVNYFATTITANDLEGSNGWVFIQRPKSQFQTNGSADWANPVTTIRIGVTSEASAVGGETAQIGPLHLSLNTRTKVINFFDDANETDATEAEPYLTANGMVGVSGIIESKVGTAGFLSEAQIASLVAAGWDMGGHHITELDTLTLSEQTALLSGIKSYLTGLGYPEAADLFVLPGGKFDTNTIAAAQAAGITALRTTIQFPYNPAVDPSLWSFQALSTAVNTGTDSTDWIAALDDAIDNKSSFATFSHGLFSTPGTYHTDLEEWKLYIDALKARVDDGKCEVVSWTEYIRGLADDIWQPRTGISFL